MGRPCSRLSKWPHTHPQPIIADVINRYGPRGPGLFAFGLTARTGTASISPGRMAWSSSWKPTRITHSPATSWTRFLATYQLLSLAFLITVLTCWFWEATRAPGDIGR